MPLIPTYKRDLQAYAQTYDAAGSQGLTTSYVDITGGAAWDGTFGPVAHNVTITATTFDGLTPLVSGLYECYVSLNWIAANPHTISLGFSRAGTVVTGAESRSMSVTETASAYQHVAMTCYLDLTAGQETTVEVKCASSSPTLTYRDLIFRIRKISPSA